MPPLTDLQRGLPTGFFRIFYASSMCSLGLAHVRPGTHDHAYPYVRPFAFISLALLFASNCQSHMCNNAIAITTMTMATATYLQWSS